MAKGKPKPHPAKKILEKHKALVWPEIKSYLIDPKFPKAFTIPKEYKNIAKLHWNMVREYPNRKGKYLRPTLLMLTAQAMGTPVDKTLKTASAMQVSEDWILIHDDIQDDSLMRRGSKTLHRTYSPELAINAGDSLQAIMWKILIDNNNILGSKLTAVIIDEFYKIVMRTTLGQTADIYWIKTNKSNFSKEDWYFIADTKSSYYTIAAPMRLGALIARANNNQLDKLAQFGLKLGRCFQLVDDILDLTSNFQGLKQKANDLYEGKRTVPIGHLLEKANSSDKKKLLRILKKPRNKKTKGEINWILNKMNEYESIEYAKNMAEDYRNMAVKILHEDLKFLSKEPARSELESLTHFILERDH